MFVTCKLGTLPRSKLARHVYVKTVKGLGCGEFAQFRTISRVHRQVTTWDLIKF